MDITSIDNCDEDDGLANLSLMLANLNRLATIATDPNRPVLVAILPEFRADGALNVLHVLTTSASDPGATTEAERQLQAAAAAIVADVDAKRAAALAQLDGEPPVRVTPVS